MRPVGHILRAGLTQEQPVLDFEALAVTNAVSTDPNNMLILDFHRRFRWERPKRSADLGIRMAPGMLFSRW